jgi:hypothetical protein
VSITATKDGRHEYCFSNQMSTIADKIVRCVFPTRDTKPLPVLNAPLVNQFQCAWCHLRWR